jgi:hypothetical protein
MCARPKPDPDPHSTKPTPVRPGARGSRRAAQSNCRLVLLLHVPPPLLLNFSLALFALALFLDLFLSIILRRAFVSCLRFIGKHRLKSMTNDERRQLAETLKTATPEVLAEIVREAESFLAEQLKAGLASDQRAINTAVYLAAILAAIVGGTATLASVGNLPGSHLTGIMPLIGCLVFALWFAVRAARPTLFFYVGNNPTKWVPDIREGRSFHDSMAGQAAIYAQGIRLNIKCLGESQTSLKFSLRAAALGVVLFTLVEFVIVCWLTAKNGLLS